MFVLNAYFCRELRFVAILRSKLRFLLRNTGVDSDFTQNFWGKKLAAGGSAPTSAQPSVLSADSELEMEGARNYTKWYQSKVITDHQSLTVAWLMVARPPLPHDGWSCRGHVQDLTNHLLAFNTSERLSSPPHSFTHTWWWSWGLQIKGRITNTKCNNCRPSRCDADKEKLERGTLCLSRVTRCPLGEALSGQSPGLFLVHLTRM